jgi:hypothetical protein
MEHVTAGESETTQSRAEELGREVEPAAVIDADAFERDREDPLWREFIQASRDHVETLERDGRSR